jgi:putative FmdB family regulatory protein
MPEYSYKCKECGNIFDKVFSFSEDNNSPLNECCPSCQKQGTVVRNYTPPNHAECFSIRKKVSNGWKDVIKKIKSDHPLGNFQSMD